MWEKLGEENSRRGSWRISKSQYPAFLSTDVIQGELSYLLVSGGQIGPYGQTREAGVSTFQSRTIQRELFEEAMEEFSLACGG